MRITIESTTKTVTLKGVPARIWEGETDDGVDVYCYVTGFGPSSVASVTPEERLRRFRQQMASHRSPTASAVRDADRRERDERRMVGRLSGDIYMDTPVKPTDPPTATCDWGDCDARAIDWRFASTMGWWLPVCEVHGGESAHIHVDPHDECGICLSAEDDQSYEVTKPCETSDKASTPLRVSIAEIDRQRSKGWTDFHPEDYCHRCGNHNPSWWIDSDRFNIAMGSHTHHQWNGIVCPSCFVSLHEEATGLQTTWQLIPAAPFRPIDCERSSHDDDLRAVRAAIAEWAAHAPLRLCDEDLAALVPEDGSWRAD
jgi:hypothetical protein